MGSILFKKAMIIDSKYEQKNNVYIGIKDKIIDYIGNEYKSGYEREYEGENKCLVPAFCNAHAHSPMSLLRGYAENMSLNDWLFKRIFPFEATLTEEDIYQSTLLSFAEMLSFGCVYTSDMYYMGSAMARAVLDSGVKSNISLAVTDNNADRLKEEYNTLINEFGSCCDRLKVDMSIHAVYTSTPPTVRLFSDIAAKYELNMHIHLSETERENFECKEKYGLTPTEYFERNGAFNVPTTAAHCVHLEEGDIEIIKQNGVTVASCPASNLKLASGICEVNRLLDKGINVALGTDSVASNNNLDMFGDMRLFSLLPKGINRDPTQITPAQCLYAATKAGTTAQGRTDCGSLTVGNRADIAVIDINKVHLTPVHDITSTLVYSANGSDVIMTIADGEILYENGEFATIDVERVKAYARKRITEKT